MRYLVLPTVAVLACAPLLAQQDKTVSSPPGFENAKGQPHSRAWGYYLGENSNQRFQAADGQFRKQVMAIKEISYRLDGGRTYNANVTSAGVGRSWTNVTLHMSECDYSKMTSTFTANPLTTPQKVFDAKMTWQTFVGTAPDPTPWGNKGHKFPFTSTWVYTGIKDILMEYVFQGGTLANNAAWTGTTSTRYYLDGVYATTFNLGGQLEYPCGDPTCSQAASYPKTTPPNCMDSAHPASTNAARNDIQGIFAYNADKPTTTLKNKISLNWRSFYTAPGAPVIKALGFAGNTVGLNIGAMCNKLYLDMTQPFLLFPDTASATVSYAPSGFTSLNTPFQPVLGGVSLWFQCAWDDSKTKFFSLTTATQRTIPTSLPPVAGPRQALRTSSLTATTGSGPSTSWAYNPIYLLTYR
ncbi:MAG: hypothetical protein ACYTF5_20680 [Planctomycetota bacterium]|jgi:hypothetical protein